MISIIVLILLILAVLFLIIFGIKYLLYGKYILDNFKHCNVIVYGAKRRGKDLLFQWVINKRKDFYYSNISYGGKHKIVKLKDISCEPNTYDNFINDNIVKTKHKFKEGKDFYISDIGNFLPSYMDSQLHKKFPSMPIFYSLSGQLYDSCIHCNSQSLTRGWKALREQADFFIKCTRTIKLPFILIVSCRTYEKYESACQNLLPLKSRFLNKYSKAQVDLYNSQNGKIKNGFIIIRKSTIKYDTRAFEKILLKGRRKY